MLPFDDDESSSSLLRDRRKPDADARSHSPNSNRQAAIRWLARPNALLTILAFTILFGISVTIYACNQLSTLQSQLDDMQRQIHHDKVSFERMIESLHAELSHVAASRMEAPFQAGVALSFGDALSMHGVKQRLMWKRTQFTSNAPLVGAWLRDPPATVLTSVELAARLPAWVRELRELHDKYASETPHQFLRAFREFLGPAVMNCAVSPAPKHLVDQAIVVIDNRQHADLEWMLRHTMHMIGPGWALVIFHDQSNYQWLVDTFHIYPGGAGENIFLQRVAQVSYEQVNSIPLSRELLDAVDCETIIIMQPDGTMLRSPYLPSAHREANRAEFDRLLSSYVYLGAPWVCDDIANPYCGVGGNGGVSLRKSSAARHMNTLINCTHDDCHWENAYLEFNKGPSDHEDYFVQEALFHNQKWTGNRVAPSHIASRFSIEKYMPNIAKYGEPDPFFVHSMHWHHERTIYYPIFAASKQYWV